MSVRNPRCLVPNKQKALTRACTRHAGLLKSELFFPIGCRLSDIQIDAASGDGIASDMLRGGPTP